MERSHFIGPVLSIGTGKWAPNELFITSIYCRQNLAFRYILGLLIAASPNCPNAVKKSLVQMISKFDLKVMGITLLTSMEHESGL